MISYMDLIQNKLVELAESGLFREIAFVDNQLHTTDVSARPSAVEANETACEFGERPVRNRRDFLRERQRWRWELLVRFDVQVNDQNFLDVLNGSPYQIPSTSDTRPVALNLVSAEYTHPPRANPSNGSRIRYEFEAVPAPK